MGSDPRIRNAEVPVPCSAAARSQLYANRSNEARWKEGQVPKVSTSHDIPLTNRYQQFILRIWSWDLSIRFQLFHDVSPFGWNLKPNTIMGSTTLITSLFTSSTCNRIHIQYRTGSKRLWCMCTHLFHGAAALACFFSIFLVYADANKQKRMLVYYAGTLYHSSTPSYRSIVPTSCATTQYPEITSQEKQCKTPNTDNLYDIHYIHIHIYIYIFIYCK